ncbi:MAG TPA: Fe-S cluster assembly protein SufD [Dehalococcoidia bacterium]|nr:Fe-S cluster assembly protein SufD [Dehalococcoidia bacterium]
MIQVPAKYKKYQEDFEALERADGSGWVHGLRREAFARFAELGFPVARRGNEKWKYTNVGPIANVTFAYPFAPQLDEVTVAELRRRVPWDDGWTNLVFVDGRYAAEASTPPAKARGLRTLRLAEAIRTDDEVARKHLARHAAFEDDAFTALNTAFLSDGAFVHVPDGEVIDAPVHLLFLSTGQSAPGVSHPRTLVVAGRGSKVTLIETYVGLTEERYFTNAVTEIALEDGAEVSHTKLLREGAEAFHVGVTRVTQAQNSVFTSASFSKGAALARSDLYVLLDGPGSSCFLNGLYMTSGTQHKDNFINIEHAKPHTTSRLYYKGILDGKSRAVFGGTVLVQKIAQKSDAQQTDKNLILSDEAEVDSKPALLIYADDVKCGHGATAGSIDEDTLFYMRSRGLDPEAASGLLIQGFAKEVLETVQIEGLRAYLDDLFLGALPRFRFQFGERP